jgi:hypothetical protein
MSQNLDERRRYIGRICLQSGKRIEDEFDEMMKAKVRRGELTQDLLDPCLRFLTGLPFTHSVR